MTKTQKNYFVIDRKVSQHINCKSIFG